mmetsp:Transcript_5474/g.12481  ORF Transcript_5474/g.12481 Transcript_5474/m.12481 type:complete len:103 (+) Transcript_5474:729-1037(+)
MLGPPYPNSECISRLHDVPLASEENNRCHRPEASVSEVHERANRSNEEDDGVGKNALVGELWVLLIGLSTEREGIQRGATLGGKRGSLPSPGAAGVKKVKST